MNDKTTLYKQSRSSYIRPVDGVTRLKGYNFSNITVFEKIVHRSSQVDVEIPNICMIIFTGDTFHAGVSTFERRNGSYSFNLRIFSYIVEDDYFSGDKNITVIKSNMLCSNCQ